MWVKYHGVNDPDQACILEELVRFLQHDSSGVSSFDRMNSSWKDVCSSVQNRIALKKGSNEVQESVGSWHQFIRNITLHLSLSIGEDVTVYLKRAHKTTDDSIAVRVFWPGRAPDTMATLAQIKERGIYILLSDNSSLKPAAFEVVLTRDLGAKFKGTKTFVQESEPLLSEFYEQAGRHLEEWVAALPKVRARNAEALIEDAGAEEVKPETADSAPATTAA